MFRTRSALALAGLTTLGLTAVVPPASAAPDTDCMRDGIAFLKEQGLFSSVAKDGLPLTTAVGAGVVPREGTDVASLPAVLPLSVVLADHRAGDSSLFLYPWCGDTAA